jgi:hypothetical protein
MVNTSKEELYAAFESVARDAVRGLVGAVQAGVAALTGETAEDSEGGPDEAQAVREIQAALEEAVAAYPGTDELTEAEIEAAFDAAFARVID